MEEAHSVNMQGGGNKLDVSLYRLVFPFIKDNDLLLNMGCGVQFIFGGSGV